MAASYPQTKKPPPGFPGDGFAARLVDLLLFGRLASAPIIFPLGGASLIEFGNRVLLLSVVLALIEAGSVHRMSFRSLRRSNRPMPIPCQRRRRHSGG
jgi:hypothetical protein